MEPSRPLVTVCIASYKQENYIAQALSSILSQKTTFIIEVLVADDCSPDNTRRIIDDYNNAYPGKLTILERAQNLGMMGNWLDMLMQAKGKYIAICEGDDYWIDNDKLQKQVSFLEKNPEYSICFTRVYEQIDHKKFVSPLNPWNSEQTFSIIDIAKHNMIHTPSVVFRRSVVEELPLWFEQSPVADYVIHMFGARNGLIKYFPDITAVYRKFAGTWSTKPIVNQFKEFNKSISLLIGDNFDDNTKKLLTEQKWNNISQYLLIMLKSNDSLYVGEMRKHLQEIGVEADFVAHWMLDIYPREIQRIQNVWIYQIYKRVNTFLIQVRRSLGVVKRKAERLLS